MLAVNEHERGIYTDQGWALNVFLPANPIRVPLGDSRSVTSLHPPEIDGKDE